MAEALGGQEVLQPLRVITASKGSARLRIGEVRAAPGASRPVLVIAGENCQDERGWSLVVREIEETQLPGVGVRYSFVSSRGQRLSVLHHRSGRREVFTEVAGDPDAARLVLELDERDSRILGELLGESRVVPDFERLQQSVGGMTLDWLTVEPTSRAAGRTIGQLAVRSTTGATIVSVLRGEEQIPNPAADVRLEPGDLAVVIGLPENCRRARDLFRGG